MHPELHNNSQSVQPTASCTALVSYTATQRHEHSAAHEVEPVTAGGSIPGNKYQAIYTSGKIRPHTRSHESH